MCPTRVQSKMALLTKIKGQNQIFNVNGNVENLAGIQNGDNIRAEVVIKGNVTNMNTAPNQRQN